MIRKIIKRIVEAVTKGYYIHLIRKSYVQPYGKCHMKVQEIAKHNFALTSEVSDLNWWQRWKMDFIVQVQRDLMLKGLLKEQKSTAKLGFKDLVMEVSSEDLNSSLVYLFGFSDSMTLFALYSLYATEATVAIDVGSNLGQHAMALSRCVGENGKVIAFEPIDRIYDRFIVNLKLNQITNVDARKAGIGDKNETVCFDDNPEDINIGKGRVSPKGKTQVQLLTIDKECVDCDKPISLIKIDIEGYELKALHGAQETLRKHKPVIVCEFNRDVYSLKDLLQAVPYQCDVYRLPNRFCDPVQMLDGSGNMHGDIVLIPKEKIKPPKFLSYEA